MSTSPAAAAPFPVLQAQGLQFAFGAKAVVRDLSLQLLPGLSVLTGDEHSGKTTVLRLLAGVLMAQAGTLRLHGIDARTDAAAYRAQVFWADPRDPRWEGVVVRHYLASVQALYPAWQADLLEALLDALALSAHLDKRFDMLSAGSRRKVFLAAGFAAGAALTLLDTPLAALDRRSCDVVLELLEEAALHPRRAWLVADYEAPAIAPLAAHITLPAPL